MTRSLSIVLVPKTRVLSFHPTGTMQPWCACLLCVQGPLELQGQAQVTGQAHAQSSLALHVRVRPVQGPCENGCREA